MKKHLSILTFFCVLALAACKKNENTTANTATVSATGKISPDGFNYATSRNVFVNLTVKAPNNDPLKGILVRFYNPADTSSSASAIYTAATDANGNIQAFVNVPTSVTNLIIDPQTIGVLRYANAIISNNNITATLGGTSIYGGNIVAPTVRTLSSSQRNFSLNRGATNLTLSGSTDFEFPSPYNTASTAGGAILNTSTYPTSIGRPSYLSSTPDVIDATMISYINSTFPEAQFLPTTHPQYFAAGVINSINVVSTGTVSITYLTGIASYNDVLAYYTYPTGNPPASTAAITNATYVFPNTSDKNSPTISLQPGDKVNLGTFTAGTTIGFILVQNGWNPTSGTVTLSNQKYYGQSSFNPDYGQGGAANGKHEVTVYDNLHKVFIMGFEDTQPSQFPYYDGDFNDAVFYASAAPGVISTTSIPTVDPGTDSDGDGIPDAIDAFPNDATRAFINYFPSQSGYAQIAFEDNWPLKGDYDMNDLVLNYQYAFVSNAQNQIVTMQGNYNVAAAGAQYKNGFGVQLPLAASMVKSVTGQKLISSYITLASNGVEANQTNAVIIPFDNHNALIANNADGNPLINTLMTEPKLTSTTASVLVTFNSPVDPSVLTVSALNPFLISNLRRGYEIHLPNHLPTSLANSALFGTGDDVSNVNSGKTYVSSQNWPWAIQFNGVFNYPTETTIVSQAYPNFLNWTGSAGISFTDWYSNLAAGYRVSSYIYSK